jgi:hypothetical protein|tara:strand:+ start:434 stop:700 length:267 start_codon:yes stop_codon:yes gene_type:complete
MKTTSSPTVGVLRSTTDDACGTWRRVRSRALFFVNTLALASYNAHSALLGVLSPCRRMVGADITCGGSRDSATRSAARPPGPSPSRCH